MSGRNPRVLAELAAIFARRGDSGAVRDILEELRPREHGFIEPSLLGCVTAAAGIDRGGAGAGGPWDRPARGVRGVRQVARVGAVPGRRRAVRRCCGPSDTAEHIRR